MINQEIMESYITNQVKLAQILGITPQWLSRIKHNCSASDTQLIQLEEVTGIPQIYWAASNRKHLLKQKLQTFFLEERRRAKAQG
jgi:plasmid maintenance system antidote protein VapI